MNLILKYKFGRLIQVMVVALLMMTSFVSCDYLNVDDYFEEQMQLDSVFVNKLNIERYLWATAASFPDEGAIFGNNYTPGVFGSDEGFIHASENEFRGVAYMMGLVTPTNLYGMDTWGNLYRIIRRSNTILARIEEVRDLTTLERMNVLAYARFIRAYAYYHLAVKYGPVVLLGDDVLENNAAAMYYDRARATMDETFDYICDELETAGAMMPAYSDISINNFGRPSSAAAYGLVARLRLIQASPLYNPKPDNPAATVYFGNWTRSTDGVHYVSQTYDERKWAVAAAAAKRVMDLGTFSLHVVNRIADTRPLPANVSDANFPDGAGNVDAFRSYSDMFTGETVAVRNPEFVWARWSDNVSGYTQHVFEMRLMGGWNCLSVTQKAVDAYRMEDGRDIHNSSAAYPYRTTGTLGANVAFSGYQLRPTVHNMYVNREARFYASIGFSQRFWTASSTSESNRKNMQVSYEASGNAGKSSSLLGSTLYNYPITGYVPTKYVHADDAWAGAGASRQPKPFPIIRYAEILLSYAEALNNLTEPHNVTDETTGDSRIFSRDQAEIAGAFNQVRYRAGLPGLTSAELSSPSEIQALMERERMVEFLFEDRRYFDVRRWGKFESEERNYPIMGMNTDASGDAYYSVVTVNHERARFRVTDRRLVLFPLALDEVRKSPSLDQNPGWQF